MIDTRELRIGTFLSQYHSWGVAVPYWRNWEIAIGDDINHVMGNPNKYNGIPLTEEWLLKFGFYEIEESEFYDKDIDGERYISINIKPKKCFVGASVDWTSIKFPESVHQLQNLYFALTGEELTIKL